jgi:cytochrome c biogenesis protein CcmG, thiol:disulfide interchange protein DsbE
MSGSGFSRSADSERSAVPSAPGRFPWPWLALGAAVALYLGYRMLGTQGPSPAATSHPAVGAKVEQFDLAPLTGDPQPLTAKDLQGKVTLVNFWGPWCGFCLQEFPHLMELEQHYRGHKDLQFVSVSCSGGPGSDEHMATTTAEFLAERQANFPTYRDPHQKLQQHLLKVGKLEGFAFPTTLVLDRQGVIRGFWVGYAPGDERQIQAIVDQTLRESASAAAAALRPSKPLVR